MIRNILLLFVLITIATGCQMNREEESETYDETTNMLLKALEVVKFTNENVKDRNPIEKLIVNSAKNKTFVDSAKIIWNGEQGVIANKYSDVFIVNVSILASLCEGDTEIYRDDELLYSFQTDDKGNSYIKLMNQLIEMSHVKKYNNDTYQDKKSLKDTTLYASFFYKDEDIDEILQDQDIYKSLRLKVVITSEMD